jgi:hypothetical protein
MGHKLTRKLATCVQCTPDNTISVANSEDGDLEGWVRRDGLGGMDADGVEGSDGAEGSEMGPGPKIRFKKVDMVDCRLNG